MPRLLGEELAGLGYEPIEYPWTEDQDASRAVRAARSVLGEGATLGADWPLPETTVVEPALARARALLTDGDITRYRALGRDAGLMLGNVCRALTPGDQERDIARAIMDGAQGLRARPIVTLVGSDDRLRHYRHPVPTAATWKSVVMSRCAPIARLVLSLSACVGRRHAGSRPRTALRRRCSAAARRALPGATAGHLMRRRRRKLGRIPGGR